MSFKENKDLVREGNSKGKTDSRDNQGPDSDLGGHDKNSELYSKCDGISLEGFEQRTDMF